MNTVIKIENLSKAYQLGQFNTGTLSRDIERWWALARGKEDPFLKIGEVNERDTQGSSDIVWSLRDINFDIEQGKVVGIIGRNGAGKSTLLKIISQVTSPTHGTIKVKGRIASLLEVGTGFHPELSGRENIFLNGAILGMRKNEISRKFDEIVDFSGVERYIDTPVKRYSSGMYVRLAFAVAAHLESEILIIDEVLAVGDAEFQKKCIGKMGDVSKSDGRTVLFVSHNIGSIVQLCSSCILLKSGQLAEKGSTQKVVESYINQGNIQIKNIANASSDLVENKFVIASMRDMKGELRNDYSFDEEICIEIGLFLPNYNSNLELAMRLVDRYQKAVFTIHESLEKYYEGRPDFSFNITLPRKFITPGMYSWVMCINHPGLRLFDLQENVLPFTILDTGSDFSRYEGVDYGSVFANYSITKTINEKIN